MQTQVVKVHSKYIPCLNKIYVVHLAEISMTKFPIFLNDHIEVLTLNRIIHLAEVG